MRPDRPRGIARTVRRSRCARIGLLTPAWLTVLASLCLWLLGVYCIDLTAGVGAGSPSGHAKKQFVLGAAGVVACGCAACVHYKSLRRWTPLLTVVSAAGLCVVLLPFVPASLVPVRNGARRWINLGVTTVQPSEIAKVVYVLGIAQYFRRRKNHRSVAGLLPPALITLLPMVLIVAEPDLGTSMLFVPAFLATLVAAGARLEHLCIAGAIALCAAPAMYPVLRPHQKQRIDAMLNQIVGDVDAQGVNYQSDKAMTLIGAGGATGMGAASRAVVDLNELPEDHNDMIFAVVVNRFGAAGGLGVVCLYLFWIGGALWTAGVCRDPFGRLVVVGLTAMVASQAFVNMGMNLGVLPITGMTLPYVSYGGSSLMIAFVTAGLVLSVGLRRPPRLSRQSFDFDDVE